MHLHDCLNLIVIEVSDYYGAIFALQLLECKLHQSTVLLKIQNSHRQCV